VPGIHEVEVEDVVLRSHDPSYGRESQVPSGRSQDEEPQEEVMARL
jgi:hypothetical protein